MSKSVMGADRSMITVTRLDGSVIVVNADLIESIEAVPDTVIGLTTHKKVVVREPVAVIVARVLEYQRAVHGSDGSAAMEDAPTTGASTGSAAPARPVAPGQER